MKVIIADLAKESLMDIYDYNSQYSLKNAIETDINIRSYIHNLEKLSNIGKHVPELANEYFRELIYRKNRNSGYRIIYYISNNVETIYVLYIVNCKQDFSKILKLHNYFSNFLKI